MGTESISITNYTKNKIQITTLPIEVNTNTEQKKYTISPRDSFVFFTDQVGSVLWEKAKD